MSRKDGEIISKEQIYEYQQRTIEKHHQKTVLKSSARRTRYRIIAKNLTESISIFFSRLIRPSKRVDKNQPSGTC